MSEPPPTFRYRSIAPRFSVWGYDVAVDRPVREFLDLDAVTEHSLVVRGTGTALITTAARYTPDASYRVDGAGTRATTVRADDDGRLTFAVDLGPPHRDEQYSPRARAQEAAGMYRFTERRISITP